MFHIMTGDDLFKEMCKKSLIETKLNNVKRKRKRKDIRLAEPRVCKVLLAVILKNQSVGFQLV